MRIKMRTIFRRQPWGWSWAAVAVWAGAAQAMVPEFSAPATVTQQSVVARDSYAMPIGPFGEQGVASRTYEGALNVSAYQIDAPGVTTLELLTPLREQVAAAGYGIVFECAADACGGYDFRYGTRIVAEPAMHVDLADFRFVSAERSGPDGPEAISLLVSRSALAGFVQVIEVGAVAATAMATATPTATQPPLLPQTAPVVPAEPGDPVATGGLGAALAARGFVVLEDVVFGSGASVLQGDEIASLAELSAWLKADTLRMVALVGHTDASGSLAVNVALGAKRAQAIRERLIESFGVSPRQVSAEGAGYLAPRASNLTEDGRRLNRRVEVILLPPQ